MEKREYVTMWTCPKYEDMKRPKKCGMRGLEATMRSKQCLSFVIDYLFVKYLFCAGSNQNRELMGKAQSHHHYVRSFSLSLSAMQLWEGCKRD